jgi:hypothetical protein
MDTVQKHNIVLMYHHHKVLEASQYSTLKRHEACGLNKRYSEYTQIIRIITFHVPLLHSVLRG